LVLRSFIGQCVFGTAAPDQLLGFCVIHVDQQGSFFVVLLSCGGVAHSHSSESSPTPSPAESVVEGLKCSLGLGRFNRYEGHIAAAVYLSPTLGGQLGIHRILDSGVPQPI